MARIGDRAALEDGTYGPEPSPHFHRPAFRRLRDAVQDRSRPDGGAGPVSLRGASAVDLLDVTFVADRRAATLSIAGAGLPDHRLTTVQRGGLACTGLPGGRPPHHAADRPDLPRVARRHAGGGGRPSAGRHLDPRRRREGATLGPARPSRPGRDRLRAGHRPARAAPADPARPGACGARRSGQARSGPDPPGRAALARRPLPRHAPPGPAERPRRPSRPARGPGAAAGAAAGGGHIGAALDRPLALHDVAAAAGCSLRRLQSGFRRDRETTLLAFIRGARLRAARTALSAAPPGTTITAIALRYGFTNAGRFAGPFRRAFGVSPAEVRRAARR